jgi:hypothetical protein
MLACSAWCSAADTDPLRSAECLGARAELDAALAAPAARENQRLQQARRAALQACLGSQPDARRRSGAPDPVQVVVPTLRATPPAPLPPPVATPPAAVAIPRAAMITTCDPGGCWDSQGRRLNRVGPVLSGPDGPCHAQGGLVTCP